MLCDEINKVINRGRQKYFRITETMLPITVYHTVKLDDVLIYKVLRNNLLHKTDLTDGYLKSKHFPFSS